jgi:hypothetical protein
MFGSPFCITRVKGEPIPAPYPKCPHGEHEWHGEPTFYCWGSCDEELQKLKEGK